MNESAEFAKKTLEDILSFFGQNLEVSVKLSEDVIELSVPSSSMNGFLIGQNGDNLRAMQHLLISILKNAEMELTRVNLDIAEYKKQRADRLAEQVMQWAESVKSSDNPMELHPMNAADRRTVHKTIGEAEGLVSSSAGEGRDRHVVISPAS
ncbi:single-stranded DNA-binding protein [Candidatus Saccharibacteria bacterium]|jgi:spoIIIJ-associated protein|nr:single-stranded DNA-binding protein [Candidatus Saccharibacteria bacterium]